ncbi:MAG: hypothetical protein ABI882_11590, partial [Acidobacteriota bacterium]
MRRLVRFLIIALFLSASATILLTIHIADAQSPPKLTKGDIDKWMIELSNWGRWGKQDQLGAVNLITAEKRKQAAALVKEGVSVSLARDVEKERATDNARPFTHTMNATGINNPSQFSLDTFSVNYHG